MSNDLVIGITDCSKYPNYENWVLRESGIAVIRLGHTLNNRDDVERCHGIILTGGEDVHPRFYGKPEYLPLCEQDNLDETRDEFEWNILDYAQLHDLPVLGICRGLQLANVFFGGTLIPDIPGAGKPDHSKVKGIDRYHSVNVIPQTFLSEIAGVSKGEVNSAHHQGADRLGLELRVNAISADGIAEGLEWEDPVDKPFLLLVQWHPERMNDQDSPLVRNILQSFLAACDVS